MSVLQISWDQALAWRLDRHRLRKRAAPGELVNVASEVCGLHAQVMSSAELSLWARIEGLERRAVHDALWSDKGLVKTWAMRGTLHLLPAAEIGEWLAALGSERSHPGRSIEPDMRKLREAVGQALDGRLLTREQLAQEVERTTGSAMLAEWVRFSWGAYLKSSAYAGKLCFGPSRGTQITFTNPARWLGRSIDQPAADEALTAITRRFLHAYAPATYEELSRWWLGPPMPKRAGRLLKLLEDELAEVEVEGERAYVLAADLESLLATKVTNTARLLPAFDPWVIGAARRPPLYPAGMVGRVYRPQGWVSPVVLVNGRIAGVWKHAMARATLQIRVEPFGALAAWVAEQLEAEAERLAAFLGCDGVHSVIEKPAVR